MAKSARAADEKTAKSSGADEKTAKSSGADDEKTAKPSKAKPRPSKKAEANWGTFAGHNWPSGPLPSMRFDAAYEAWTECPDCIQSNPKPQTPTEASR